MATDLLAPDTSRVIDSLDDMLANRSIGVMMNSGLPDYTALSREKPSSKLGQIFSRVHVNESSLMSWRSMQLVHQMLDKYQRRDQVLIMNEDTLSYLLWTSCYALNTSDNWISRHSFYEMIAAPMYNKQISKTMKWYLDQKSYKIHESGLFVHIWLNHVTNPSNYYQDEFGVKPVVQCIVTDLDAFIGDQRYQKGSNELTNHCLLGVWRLLVSGLLVSLIAGIIERIRPQKVARKAKKAIYRKLFHRTKKVDTKKRSSA